MKTNAILTLIVVQRYIDAAQASTVLQ